MIIQKLYENRITLLNEKFENNVNVSKISKILGIEYSNIHHQIKILEYHGIIRKTKPFNKTIVELTRKGEKIGKHVNIILNELKKTKVKK